MVRQVPDLANPLVRHKVPMSDPAGNRFRASIVRSIRKRGTHAATARDIIQSIQGREKGTLYFFRAPPTGPTQGFQALIETLRTLARRASEGAPDFAPVFRPRFGFLPKPSAIHRHSRGVSLNHPRWRVGLEWMAASVLCHLAIKAGFQASRSGPSA
jgi:hypothetical protein